MRRHSPFKLITFMSWTMLAAAIPLAGCGPVPEGEEEEVASTSQELTQSREVDVGFGIKRPMKIQCGTSCAAWQSQPVKGSPPKRVCTRFVEDCKAPPKSVKLYPDTVYRDNDLPYPAAAGEDCGSECVRWQTTGPAPKPGFPRPKKCVEYRKKCTPWQYKGCRPQAVMNVLHYYGVEIGITEAAGRTDTIRFSDSAIGSSPDDVAESLQALLNERADGIFTVRRKSYVDIRAEVQAAIRKGTPIIVLVNDGTTS